MKNVDLKVLKLLTNKIDKNVIRLLTFKLKRKLNINIF